MKFLERYYKKIYRHTNWLMKKVFGYDVMKGMKEQSEIKKEIEKEIDKPISEITNEDLINKKLSYKYCRWRTLDKILSVLSGASFLNSFCEEDISLVQEL